MNGPRLLRLGWVAAALLVALLVYVGRVSDHALPRTPAPATTEPLPAPPSPFAEHPPPNDMLALVPLGFRIRGSIEAMGTADGALWAMWDNSLVRLGTHVEQIDARIVLGNALGGFVGLAFTPGSVWALNGFTGTLYRVDVATNRIVVHVHVGQDSQVTADAAGLWAKACPNGDQRPGSVLRLDPATGRVVARIALGACPAGLLASGGVVWAMSSGASLWTISAATDRVVHRVAVGAAGDGSFNQGGNLALAGGSLWAPGPLGLVRFDPATGRVQAVVNTDAVTPSAGAGALWTTRFGDVVRVSLRSDLVDAATSVPDANAVGLTFGAGSVWVASVALHNLEIARVNPARVPHSE